MPNIPQFEVSPQGAQLHPNEEGPSAFARIGREQQYTSEQAGRVIAQGAGKLGEAAGGIYNSIEKHQTTQQFVQGMQQSTAAQIKFDDAKQQALNSPDPTNTMKDVITQFGEELDKIGGTFTTDEGQRQWAEHRASVFNQFAVHGMAEASTAVGEHTIASVESTKNNLIAQVDANPHNVDGVLDQLHQLFTGAKGNLTAPQQAELDKEEISTRNQIGLVSVNSAAKTFFKNNPEKTADDFPMGDLAKDAAGNSVLTAEGQLHAQAIVKAAKVQNDQVVREKSQDAIDQHTGAIYDPSTFRVNLSAAVQQGGAIQADPNIRRQDKNRAVGFIGTAVRQQLAEDLGFEAQRATKDDPATVYRLLKGVGDLEKPTTLEDIGLAMEKHQITVTRGMELSARINRPATDAMKKISDNPIVKTQFDQAAAMIRGNVDPGNQAVRDKTDQFKIDTLKTLQDVMAGGGDPRPYLDPKSPQYLFSPERVKQYQPTKDEIANQVVVKVAPGGQTSTPPAAKPSALEFMQNWMRGKVSGDALKAPVAPGSFEKQNAGGGA